MSFGIEDIFNLDVLGYFLLVLIVGEFNLQLLIWFRIGYTIEAGFLLIRSGPFKRKINLSDIKKLRPTKVPFPAMIPFTSPAFSSERIEVVYGKRDEYLSIK